MTKPKKKMKKSKLDLRCNEGVTMQILSIVTPEVRISENDTNS